MLLYCRNRQMWRVRRWPESIRRVPCSVWVDGWKGRGMTIGFREQAMWTDGPWLPPKIPLRKMAGLTYFWTHHAAQIYCTGVIGWTSTDIGYNPNCFVGHYGIRCVVTAAVKQESIGHDVASESGFTYFQPSKYRFVQHGALEGLMRLEPRSFCFHLSSTCSGFVWTALSKRHFLLKLQLAICCSDASGPHKSPETGFLHPLINIQTAPANFEQL